MAPTIWPPGGAPPLQLDTAHLNSRAWRQGIDPSQWPAIYASQAAAKAAAIAQAEENLSGTSMGIPDRE